MSPTARSLQEGMAASSYRCLKNKEVFPSGGNFLWIPSDTASPPETCRSVQTQLCPAPDLARCPGGESGNAVFTLAPDSLEGQGQGSQVPCMANDPAARAWRKQPEMVQEFHDRVSTVGTENPRGGPGAVKIPRPSSSPTPTGAVSGTHAQSCQSSTQAGRSPSMWALPAVLQNPVWLQSTPDALGALRGKDVGSCSERYRKAVRTLELREASLSMWVLPSPPGTTVLSPVALQEPQEPPLEACSSQSDAQLRLQLHLKGTKPPAKRGPHGMSDPLGPSSPRPPSCLLPCPRPPGAL